MPVVCADRPWGNVWGNRSHLLQIHLRLSLAHNLCDFRNANDDRTAAFKAKDAVFPLVTRLRLKGAGPRLLFAFAGLWQRHVGPVKKDGAPVEIDVYSFMTTTPNALVEAINHERMPVGLSTEEVFETWINGSTEEAFDLLREYPPNEMQIVQEVSQKRDLLIT